MAGLLGDVLPWVYRTGNEVKGRVKGLLADPKGFVGNLEQDAMTVRDQVDAAAYQTMARQDPAHAAKVYPTMAKSDKKFVEQQALLHQNRIMEMALNGMTVYHGSPHKFDKFDMSKIGTGEGAQAYGHGLYFAENPQVAGSYKTAGRAENYEAVEYAGQVYKPGSMRAQTLAEAARNGRRAVIDRLEKSAESNATYAPDQAALARAEIDFVKKLNPDHVKFHGEGALYKVDLPDEAIAKMLDWDKPLSQQPEYVRKILSKDPVAKAKMHMTGREIYGSVGSRAADSTGFTQPHGVNGEATAYLKKLGIPGIRYADQGSRGAQGGTSNFVVFDDQLPKIVERK